MTLSRLRPLARVSTLALLVALPGLGSAQDAPVTAITLFEAGLAEVTRDTQDAGSVTLSVPMKDVNDVLKSLLLRGQGITGASLTLDGAQPVEDAFASLPFPPAAATDLPTLLRSVPGLRVRLTDSAFPNGLEGTLMGVTDTCSEEKGCETLLTLVTDEGTIRRQVFTPDLELTILDEDIVAGLARGLGALREAASGTVREITVAIEGEGIEDGALTYVIAAPTWKTAYRAVTGAEGDVDLQAWAVIENATGEDWEDVALTLSSGSPFTLTSDLHGRTWAWRESVEAKTGNEATMMAPAPMMAMADAVFGAGIAAEDTNLMARAQEFAAPASVAASTSSSEGVLDSRFAFDRLIDLEAGEMISLPFLADSLEASHVSLYQGGLMTRTGHPDMVLELTNDLGVRLPAGIMTVSDETGGYVGDAAFPLVGPGETRTVPFGEDLKVRIEEETTSSSRQVSVKASGGVIRMMQEEVRETTYRLASPALEAREVVIDHPLHGGWETAVLEGPSGEERQDEAGARWLRVTIDLQAGDEDGEALSLRDSQLLEQSFQIAQLSEDQVLYWSGQAMDEGTAAYLAEAARLMRDLSQARDALGQLEAARRELEAEQTRVSALLRSVTQPSEAHDRFMGQILDLEDRMAGSWTGIESARATVEQAEAALADHLEV